MEASEESTTMWQPVVIPHLTGSVILEPPARGHAPGLFAYGRDPAFHRFIGSRPFATESEAELFAKRLAADNDAGRRCYWVVVDPADGMAVGTLGFNFLFPPAQRMADFGYGVAPSHWGQGVFRAAAQLVLNFGFATLGLERIQIMTRADNLGSVRSVEALGFRREGTLRRFYRIGEARPDCTVLGLLREEWTPS